MSLKQRTTELSNFQFSLLLALPVLVFLVLVVAYPLGYALWMSVHEISFFGGYKATFVGAENYADVIGDRKFKKSLWITVRFTLESVALAMVIGLLIALVLNRPMRFAGLVRTIVILPGASRFTAPGSSSPIWPRGRPASAPPSPTRWGSKRR